MSSSVSWNRRAFLGALGAVGALGMTGTDALRGTAAFADDARTALGDLANLRFGMFNHFNLGTFTDEEWAAPHQSPALFAPSSVSCEQWADAAVAAGMSYGVLTTKHHDGFALWPSAFGTQNVANSRYPHDIVAQYVTAFRSRGLKVGLYFSIWDRTFGVQAYDTRHGVGPAEAVQPADTTFVLNQIRELLTGYGTVDLFVTDGYAWQMGQQAISYQQVRTLVKTLQPNCVMVDHGGLSEPWLGDAIYFEAPLGIRSPAGNTCASLQGETISNGWFWHPSTPTTDPMSKQAVLAALADLEPKYTSLILNCPPNRDGVLDANIVRRLAEVGAAWSPDLSRPGLPTQPLRVEEPINPVNAYASGSHSGEGPLHAIDGLSDAGFETCWSTWSLALPQTITIDLGGLWSAVTTLEYLPKQWNRTESTDGDITAAVISTSTDGVVFAQSATVTWASNRKPKVAEWAARDAAFVRIQVTAAAGGYANVSGLRIGGRLSRPALISRFPEAGTVYRLAAGHSAKVADVFNFGTADGTNIQQWPWSGNRCQQWTFISTGDGYFKIRDRNSGKLMEVAGLSRADGGNVAIWADADVPQQHWAVTPVGDGYFVIVNRLSGRALTVSGASTADGANIEQRGYSGSAAQQWQLIES